MLSEAQRDKFAEDLSKPVEDEDAMERVQRLLDEMKKEALKNIPLEFRINYASNLISNVCSKIGDLSTEEMDTIINWDKINEILFDNLMPDDYNIVQKISSIKELANLRGNLIAASLGLGAWVKKNCRDCGKTFYLDHKEIDFFKNKSLAVPTRCKECREARKNKNTNGGKLKCPD